MFFMLIFLKFRIMTIFIEYVLIDNFIINYLLLKITFSALNKDFSKKRLMFSAIFGAVFALILPLFSLNNVLGFLVKVLFGVVLLSVSNSYKSDKEYIVSLITFIFFTFTFGGLVFAFFYLTGIDYSTEISIALIFLPIIVFYKCIKSIFSYLITKKKIEVFVYDLEITALEKKIKCKGFLDTGNNVMINGRPAVFIRFKLVEKHFSIDFIKGLKRSNVKTINGEKEKFYFTLNELKVFSKDNVNIYNNVTAFIFNDDLIDGYDIILNPALFFGGVYENIA